MKQLESIFEIHLDNKLIGHGFGCNFPFPDYLNLLLVIINPSSFSSSILNGSIIELKYCLLTKSKKFGKNRKIFTKKIININISIIMIEIRPLDNLNLDENLVYTIFESETHSLNKEIYCFYGNNMIIIR